MGNRIKRDIMVHRFGPLRREICEDAMVANEMVVERIWEHFLRHQAQN